MKPQSLQVYVNGRSNPGAEIFRKFKDLGCDINWLLTDDTGPPLEATQLLHTRIKELEEKNQRLKDSIIQLAHLFEKEMKDIIKNKCPKKS